MGFFDIFRRKRPQNRSEEDILLSVERKRQLKEMRDLQHEIAIKELEFQKADLEAAIGELYPDEEENPLNDIFKQLAENIIRQKMPQLIAQPSPPNVSTITDAEIDAHLAGLSSNVKNQLKKLPDDKLSEEIMTLSPQVTHDVAQRVIVKLRAAP